MDELKHCTDTVTTLPPKTFEIHFDLIKKLYSFFAFEVLSLADSCQLPLLALGRAECDEVRKPPKLTLVYASRQSLLWCTSVDLISSISECH